MKPRTIFYSWQSDSDPTLNRSFIEDCLKRAVSKLNRDDLLQVVVDRDTKGVAGMPNIGDTIFEKIARSSVVVADLSIINPHSERRPDERAVPNPNVLFELGFALGKLGSASVIGVLNTHSGAVDELPFDLRPKRIITYEFDGQSDRPAMRSYLADRLASAIKECLGETEGIVIQRNSRAHEIMRSIWVLGTEVGDRFGDSSLAIAIRESLVSAEELPTLLQQNDFPVGAQNIASSIVNALRRAATIEFTDENWSEVSSLLASGADKARNLVDLLQFSLDPASSQENLRRLAVVHSNIRQCLLNTEHEVRLKDLEAASIELRQISFLKLLQQHPRFQVAVRETSFEIRVLLLRWKSGRVAEPEAVQQLTAATSRLEDVLKKYNVGSVPHSGSNAD